MNWFYCKVADLLIAYAKRHPYFHLPGYMERYWLVKYHRYQPYSIRVHHILRSDEGIYLHDHPWPYITIILRGGYREITQDRHGHTHTHWYGPGRVLVRKASHAHRLVVPWGVDTWTLFIMGRKVKEGWGFYLPKGKVPWREHLAKDNPNHTEEKVNE